MNNDGSLKLPVLDRFLPLWIFLAMALGVLIGFIFPDVGQVLDHFKIAGVSLPIAFVVDDVSGACKGEI